MKLTARSLLLDSFDRKMDETVRDKSFYWTVLTEKLMKLSAISLLLDSFDRKTYETVRDKPSIRQF